MKNTISLFLLFFIGSQANAQLIKEKAIDANIGLGLNAAYDEAADNLNGTGLYVQGEFVMGITSWLDARPYAGYVYAKTDSDDNEPNEPNYMLETSAFLIGAKVRVKAPIPWVAPFIEFGYGASIGSFRTFTSNDDIDKSGLVGHVPVSIGLELGPKHNVDIAFTYYYHTSVRQFAGAAAIGFTLTLGS